MADETSLCLSNDRQELFGKSILLELIRRNAWSKIKGHAEITFIYFQR